MSVDLSALPTSGGYDVIATPREIHSRPDLRILINTPEDLLARHVSQLAQFHKPAQWHCETPVTAYVSANRWVFICPQCRGQVSCGPAWPIGCCFECGAVCDQITYPENAADLEATLLARPGLFNRHWSPQESHADLVAENLDHDCHPGACDAAQHLAQQLRAMRAKAVS